MAVKKSQVSVQFNWIFVLIAGAIILSFFTTIIIKQRGLAEQQIAADLIKRLETEFVSAKAGTGTAARIGMHDKEIGFKCEEYTIGEKGKGLSQDILYRPVFSPDLVKGQNMVVWSMPWKTPYKVNNFLFVTTPGVRYILVGNDDNIIEMEKDLKNKFLTIERREISEISSVKSTTGYKIKFVCWECDIQNLIKKENLGGFSDEDIKAINLSSDKVEFWGMKESRMQLEKTITHLGFDKYGKPSIYAAMFANNAENYECNMEKAFENLNVVSRVYEQRTVKLSEQAENCFYFIDDLTTMSELNFSETGIQRLKTTIPSLENQQRVARRASCPLVY